MLASAPEPAAPMPIVTASTVAVASIVWIASASMCIEPPCAVAVEPSMYAEVVFAIMLSAMPMPTAIPATPPATDTETRLAVASELSTASTEIEPEASTSEPSSMIAAISPLLSLMAVAAVTAAPRLMIEIAADTAIATGVALIVDRDSALTTTLPPLVSTHEFSIPASVRPVLLLTITPDATASEN